MHCGPTINLYVSNKVCGMYVRIQSIPQHSKYTFFVDPMMNKFQSQNPPLASRLLEDVILQEMTAWLEMMNCVRDKYLN